MKRPGIRCLLAALGLCAVPSIAHAQDAGPVTLAEVSAAL